MEKITLQPDGRWHVPFEDSGSWRVGVYNPEFNSASEIDVLEKHTCSELFICTGGRMGLLLSEEGRENEVILQPNDAVMVTEYHNGFRVDREGFFIVVEQTEFSTEYVDRKTGRVLPHED